VSDEDLFTDDVLRQPPSWSDILARGLRKRCPRCGGGDLYRTWFRMKEWCPTCGMVFEREEGFFVGAYLINFAIVEISLFVVLMVFIVVLSQNSNASLVLPLAIGVFLAIVVPLLTYSRSRTIWAAIVLAMNPLELEEIVEAEDHLEDRKPSTPHDP
jgi:uncharacterized protein (DUF983 family)